MWLMGADEEEVGLFGIGSIFHPGDRLCYDGIAIPLTDFAYLFTIAYPAVGVFGAVEGVDGSPKPMVEAVVAGVRLGGEVAEVPLANEAGVVTLLFEQSGEGGFFFAQMAAFWSCDGVESCPIRGAASEEAGA